MGHRVPEEVWLTGKGPSLLSHKWQGHETIVCINESVFYVPNPFAAIAIDYDVLEKYKDLDCIVIRKWRHAQYHFKNMWLWYKQDANLSQHATAVIATQLLYKWGARTIHYVGFDAIDGCIEYAKGLNGNIKKLNEICDDLLKVIGLLGIQPVWEHR
jgi:uncharacterized protein YkvS